MNTAAASVISASASAPPIWNSRRKTSEVLRKLSLNAAKNWVQNRGAKRRVISRDEDMVFPLVPTGAGPRCATNAGSVSSFFPQAKRRGERVGVRGSLRARPSPNGRHGNSPQAGRGHVPRCRPTGDGGLRDDNLGKRTIARRGWREGNADGARQTPIVHKTKAGGPGPPAAQVLPGSISLPPQGLPAALHQNGCDAQTNGGPTCERKERDPHGVPRSSVVHSASIVS